MYFLTDTSNTLGAGGYNLFPGLENMIYQSPKDFWMQIVNIGYSAIAILIIFFFAYKLVKAVYLYNTRAVHEIQKNQLSQEIIEPIVGMFMFVAFHMVISILLREFLGVDLRIVFF